MNSVTPIMSTLTQSEYGSYASVVPDCPTQHQCTTGECYAPQGAMYDEYEAAYNRQRGLKPGDQMDCISYISREQGGMIGKTCKTEDQLRKRGSQFASAMCNETRNENRMWESMVNSGKSQCGAGSILPGDVRGGGHGAMVLMDMVGQKHKHISPLFEQIKADPNFKTAPRWKTSYAGVPFYTEEL